MDGDDSSRLDVEHPPSIGLHFDFNSRSLRRRSRSFRDGKTWALPSSVNGSAVNTFNGFILSDRRDENNQTMTWGDIVEMSKDVLAILLCGVYAGEGCIAMVREDIMRRMDKINPPAAACS